LPLTRHAASVAVLAVWTFAAAPGRADATVPACRGHNPAAAAAARTEGLKHYRASKREGHDDAEMTAALGFFDAACAAGDDKALELRAYALAGVERFIEAAETLDAFLAAHPLESLPADTRARLASQQPAILSRVASLTVETDAPGAKVTINHEAAGVTPLHSVRLRPGRYDLEVSGEGIGTISRSLDLVPGDRTERFTPGAPPPTGAPATAPHETVRHDEPAINRPSLHGWAVGTAVGAGVLLLGGVAGAIWSEERTSYYDSNGCATLNKAGCSSTLTQAHAATGIAVAGFVGAGVGAIAAGVLFYRDRGRAHAPPAALGAVSCSPTGAGFACFGTF